MESGVMSHRRDIARSSRLSGGSVDDAVPVRVAGTRGVSGSTLTVSASSAGPDRWLHATEAAR
jgi:hypothetical protein